ncbi:bifunctional GNAT family N-acetyltransferase/carbon-nitrogen hydrolase family protein [Kiritimatiellota bacterium B12222]|nr:bifunctional GNAT family N-acetyltransferase/carbon-nitrogen hydrolase family protein [Kiritimatiellota bacterium B12222]
MKNSPLDAVELRRMTLDDYQALKPAVLKSYGGNEAMCWKDAHLQQLIDLFPQGQLCVCIGDQVVACALSIIVDYSKFGDKHTYNQIIGNHSFDTHDADGDVLYGIEVFVDADYRGLRLGRRLYDARKTLCEEMNLRAILAGGRIPNYASFADELTPREYIDKVKQREIHDPTLRFQLANDFHVRKILRNYLPGDTESKEYATLLEWINIYYDADLEDRVHALPVQVRIGVVQWQMRPYDSMDALMKNAEYFVDAVSDYGSDFILFPELFNAPLMAPYNHLSEVEAIRRLAGYSEPLRDQFLKLAVSYNVNIITGSMPHLLPDDKLVNISWLCRRDGSWDSVAKIHPTPSEVSAWGMNGGTEIRALDTDCGKIGILICYDSEFPEAARILAEQGMNILFVPFLTDTQNGYMRVRHCAQARAIENECYVVMAGAVGNLPNVNNMDIQYAQSAVLTPSDFAFPTNTIKAEATPNTEMVLLADVDLDLLKELHERGSVQNMKDRRLDLYGVSYKVPKQP